MRGLNPRFRRYAQHKPQAAAATGLFNQRVQSELRSSASAAPFVVGVPPKTGTEAFVPFLKGTDPPTGFSFHGLGNLDNVRRLYDDYFYLLVGETGSVKAFPDAFDDEVRDAILLDLGWSYQDRKVDTLVQDALIVAFRRLQTLGDQSRDYRSMETHTLYQQASRGAGLNHWASAIAEFRNRVD